MENVGIFFGHLDYFTVIWYILWPFGNVMVIWYIFPRFVPRVKKNLPTLITRTYIASFVRGGGG
jgi:hypothetical protein